MTLKNIPLPATVLVNLFKHSLVEQQDNKSPMAQEGIAINFIGGNKKHILLLVNNADTDILPDEELAFLSGILTACKLSINDVAIVNLKKCDALEYKNIPHFLKSEIIFLFDVELSLLELPFKIPPFQVQQYSGKKYIYIPSLHMIQNDTALKKRLWELLRILFSV